MNKAKPFSISKQQVWSAYKRVRANKGSAGFDGQSIESFESDLSNNLYKLWNRLASGSYLPPPVKRVEIPKANGKTRSLGIPTVADRVAQMVAKEALEPLLEPHFHEDSYGYRPNKSALNAVAIARKRCWRYNWALELDIKAFFDCIDHDLLMKAVCHHTDNPWLILYVKRWLKASVALKDGTLVNPEKGTPQGGVISPLLANLYLHYAFDFWMQKVFPDVPFERYADDAVCHCRSEAEAVQLREALEQRFIECGLTLHPDKTKVVYCKDVDRPLDFPVTSFDFLGYTFRPRLSKNRHGKYFVNFTPAISNKAAKAIRSEVKNWKWNLRPGDSLSSIARESNPKIRGWLNYYARFCPSELHKVLAHIDRRLVLWATHKYKSLKGRSRKAKRWLKQIISRDRHLFVHWSVIHKHG